MTEPYRVIGQCDLTCEWLPIENPSWRSEFGKPAARCPVRPPEMDSQRRGLVWRGPEWPWRDEAPYLANAA